MAEKEYIERETAYPLAKKICDAIDSEDFQRLNFGMRILDWIDDFPAADVRPVKRGRWKRVVDFTGVEAFGIKETMVVGWGCNVCGYEVDVSEESFNFCPNCGADMRETDDEKVKEP